MNRIFVILILVLGLGLVGSTAQVRGDTKYFCADQDNLWSGINGQNWRTFAGQENCANGTRVDAPTAADRAVIVSGKTCNINSDAEADSLDVESTATLNIGDDVSVYSLTLDGHDNNSTVAGTLNLQGSTSLLAFTINSQTIDGAGKIVGQDNAAQITVAQFITLTSDVVIEGRLKITGAGDFVNTGTVHANVASTTLEISTNTFDDDSTALWRISAPNAIMLLNATSGTAGVLEGAFTVSDGKMDIDAPGFETSGRLTYTGGTIDASGLSGSEVAKFTG